MKKINELIQGDKVRIFYSISNSVVDVNIVNVNSEERIITVTSPWFGEEELIISECSSLENSKVKVTFKGSSLIGELKVI